MLPLGHIDLQRGVYSLGFFPAFGGQHFHPLGQQDCSFTLHHDLVLQVVYGFHHFGQLHLQTCQRLARQRGTGFGGIALPSQGVSNIDAGVAEQLLRALSPLGGQGVLASGFFELIQLFTQIFGRALVTRRQFFVNVLHVL